jgi:hypothetical protein
VAGAEFSRGRERQAGDIDLRIGQMMRMLMGYWQDLNSMSRLE